MTNSQAFLDEQEKKIHLLSLVLGLLGPLGDSAEEDSEDEAEQEGGAEQAEDDVSVGTSGHLDVEVMDAADMEGLESHQVGLQTPLQDVLATALQAEVLVVEDVTQTSNLAAAA